MQTSRQQTIESLQQETHIPYILPEELYSCWDVFWEDLAEAIEPENQQIVDYVLAHITDITRYYVLNELKSMGIASILPETVDNIVKNLSDGEYYVVNDLTDIQDGTEFFLYQELNNALGGILPDPIEIGVRGSCSEWNPMMVYDDNALDEIRACSIYTKA